MVVGVHENGWQEDARRVKAVREAIGPDIELMIDANYKFSPVDAKQLCRSIEDLDQRGLKNLYLQMTPKH